MRLHIFGASGSGVTTTGQALSAIRNIPYFDSDSYFWEPSDPPYSVRREPGLRNRLIRADLDRHQEWILGGSVIHWGADAFPPFDLIVFCWLPPEIRMARLREREYRRYGDRIHTDPVRRGQYETFLAWAADYDTATGIANRNIRSHEQWLREQTAPVLELRGDLSTEERISRIISRVHSLAP